MNKKEKTVYNRTPLKGKRKNIEPKMIYFSWFPTYDCNYRCTYCAVQEVAHTPFQNPPGFKVKSPAEWEKIFKRIYDKYGTIFIHVNGGEPFYYPKFIEIIERLAKYHIMEFSTNLSFDVDRFIGSIPPERVYLIGSSFHPEFVEYDEYIKKLKKLIDAGYEARFNIVAFPPFLDKIEAQLKEIHDKGIKSTVLLFHGKYEGKNYPDAYTKEDKEIMLKYKKYLGPEFETMINWSLRDKENSENENDEQEKPPVEDQYETAEQEMNREDEKNDSEEVYCRMGQMYARVHPDGEAIRCCAKTDVVVGNIFDESFALYEEPEICDNPDCICWRHMLVGREDEWKHGWPEAIEDKKND